MGIQIEMKLIETLIHPEYNPRKITEEDFEDLKKSLKRFEAVEPAVVNSFPGRENIIIGGNQRIRAAQALGWAAFPCVAVSLPEEKERELNVRLNKNTGEWDFDKLANEFEIDDLREWGFDDNELGIPEFYPVGAGEQGKLDQLSPKIVTCPKCKHSFDCNAKD